MSDRVLTVTILFLINKVVVFERLAFLGYIILSVFASYLFSVMTAVASQFESILELLQKDEMSKVQEELSKLKDITYIIFHLIIV